MIYKNIRYKYEKKYIKNEVINYTSTEKFHEISTIRLIHADYLIEKDTEKLHEIRRIDL